MSYLQRTFTTGHHHPEGDDLIKAQHYFERLFYDSVRVNAMGRLAHEAYGYQYRPFEAAIMFRTIRLHVGRGLGETYCLLKQSLPGDIIVVDTEARKQWLVRALKGTDKKVDIVVFRGTYSVNELRSKRYNNVWIDAPCLREWSRPVLSILYEVLALPDPLQTFIIFGNDL